MADLDYNCPDKRAVLQKLEEKAAKAEEAYQREAKAKKDLEALYAKLLAEKTELLSQLEGEKGSLSEIAERANKLQAQKSDLESQLSVSTVLLNSLNFARYRVTYGCRFGKIPAFSGRVTKKAGVATRKISVSPSSPPINHRLSQILFSTRSNHVVSASLSSASSFL